jgi:hypothetical protein
LLTMHCIVQNMGGMLKEKENENYQLQGTRSCTGGPQETEEDKSQNVEEIFAGAFFCPNTLISLTTCRKQEPKTWSSRQVDIGFLLNTFSLSFIACH